MVVESRKALVVQFGRINLARVTILTGKNAACPLPRSRDQKMLFFSDQQFYSAAADYSPTFQSTVAGGIVFQMDQAAPADQVLLRDVAKCGQDSGLDRHFRLCPCRNTQKKAGPRTKSLHNFTGFERHYFGKNSHFIGIPGYGLQ